MARGGRRVGWQRRHVRECHRAEGGGARAQSSISGSVRGAGSVSMVERRGCDLALERLFSRETSLRERTPLALRTLRYVTV